MKIVDIKEQYYPTYACCFEEWSEEMTNAGDYKRIWYDCMKDRGLGVKLAIDDDGEVCGMIQYLPAEYSFIEGDGFYLITCIWVYGYEDKGIGNRQNKGIGTALLQAVEDELKKKGIKGIAAWGLSQPFWMPTSFYKKHGFKTADSRGIQELVWKAYDEDVKSPRWLRMRKRPQQEEGKVLITAFISGWCTVVNVGFENFRKAAKELGDKVEFRTINTLDSETIREWGMTDAIFIDDQEIDLGPPPSYEDTLKIITDKLRAL